MDKELIKSRITEIGTCEDETHRRELLTTLQEDVFKDYDELSELRIKSENLTKDNETLRSANMKLFLRVGEQKSPEDLAKEKGLDPSEPEKKLEFKDLFDEKGNLK